jgi:hypothetical protein
MPMTVEEYRIAQVSSHQRSSTDRPSGKLTHSKLTRLFYFFQIYMIDKKSRTESKGASSPDEKSGVEVRIRALPA